MPFGVVTAACLSSGVVTYYTSGQHAYGTLLFVAGATLIGSMILVLVLMLTGYRRLALGTALVCLIGLVAATKAVYRFRADFENVEPRALARHDPPADPAATPASAGDPAASKHPPVVEPTPTANPPSTSGRTQPSQFLADLNTTTPRDFPQFLGPQRRAFAAGLRLDTNWAGNPPKLIWRQAIGSGWSAFSVVNGFAVTLEQRENEEVVSCYEVTTGRLVWSQSIKARYGNPEWPQAGIGPRSTPTIYDGMVYTLGATARLQALRGFDGKLIWKRDLLEEHKLGPERERQLVPFGRSNSPLLYNDLVIVPAGAFGDERRVSLAAYHRKTGELVWEAGNRHISYASPTLATLAGVQQILSVNEDTVSGHDPNRGGALLWEISWPGDSKGPVNASQAVPVPPNRFFISKSYGGGGALFEIVSRGDGTFGTTEVWKSNRVMRTRFTNVAIAGEYVYGLSDGILECIHLDTGERMWKNGRYGHGQLLLVGDSLLVLTESGEVVVIEASPSSNNNVLGRFQAIEGTTWNNIALYGPFLLVRNSNEAACYLLPLRS